MSNVLSPNLPALFWGEDNNLFQSAKDAMGAQGRYIALARTQEKLNEFLTTRKIKLVIIDVSTDTETANKIIQEIRKNRPDLALLALTSFPHKGTSIYEVLAYNYYCISKGIDGTITVEQFKNAIAKIEKQNAARMWRIVLAIFCAVCIAVLTLMSASRLVNFLGAFWLLILGIELGYCSLFFRLSGKPNESSGSDQ